MKHFVLVKTEDKCSIAKHKSFCGGYQFNSKFKICLYEKSMIKYILKRKLDRSFSKLVKLYYLIECDDEEGEVSNLTAKIDAMRISLLEDYSKYIGSKSTESYLAKLEIIEGRIQNNKSIHR